MIYNKYKELIDLNNESIEIAMNRVFTIKKNKEGEIIKIIINSDIDYYTLIGMYRLISDSYLENIEYERLMQEEIEQIKIKRLDVNAK